MIYRIVSANLYRMSITSPGPKVFSGMSPGACLLSVHKVLATLLNRNLLKSVFAWSKQYVPNS